MALTKRFGSRIPSTMLVLAVGMTLSSGCGRLPDFLAPTEPIKRTLQLAMTEPRSIDPGIASRSEELTIVNLLFEPLTRVLRDGTVVPAAAESWEIAGAGRTFHFRLRSGAKWQSAKRLTSRDFRYAWTRNLSPEVAADYSYLLYSIAGAQNYAEGLTDVDDRVAITATAAGELRVDLEKPSSSFLARTATWTFMPLPRDPINDWGDRWTEASHIDTNGPYRLVEWFHGHSMKLVPNPNYWDSSRPRFDEILVKIVGPEDPLIPLFQSQVADVIKLDGRDLQTVRENDQLRALTTVFPVAGNWFLVFNVRKEPWADVRVRKAFSMVIDRTALVRLVFSGSEQPATSLIPRAIAGDYRESLNTDAAVVSEALRLLADAGYPNGEGFPGSKLSYHRTSQWERLGAALVDRWAAILGVDVSHDVMEWREYLDFTESPGDFDIYRAGWNSEYLDPENWHNVLWFSGDDFLRSGWENSEYDSLVERGNVTADQRVRWDMYSAAQEILDDEVPGMPIAERGVAYLIQPYVNGVWASPLGGYLVLDDTVIERPD